MAHITFKRQDIQLPRDMYRNQALLCKSWEEGDVSGGCGGGGGGGGCGDVGGGGGGGSGCGDGSVGGEDGDDGSLYKYIIL